MQKRFLIIYHNEDNDGLFSAALFLDYLMSKLHVDRSNIHLLGANYNTLKEFFDENPVDELHSKYGTIIMTDISSNDPNVMYQLYKEFDSDFIWCDHHKPIIDASYKYNFDSCSGVRNINKSAILCAYEYLYDQLNEKYSQIHTNTDAKVFPEFFRILSAWDSWSYEREGYGKEYVRNINKGTTVEFGLDIDKVLKVVHHIVGIYDSGLDSRYEDDLISSMHQLGKSLNSYDDKTMDNIIKTSGDCSWKVDLGSMNGEKDPSYIKACAIFHEGASNSLMFKSLKDSGIDIGLVFKHQPNGNWVLSMYNVDDNFWLHCGEFLKERYNGGGHKGAAGCTLNEKQFIKILQERKL